MQLGKQPAPHHQISTCEALSAVFVSYRLLDLTLQPTTQRHGSPHQRLQLEVLDLPRLDLRDCGLTDPIRFAISLCESPRASRNAMTSCSRRISFNASSTCCCRNSVDGSDKVGVTLRGLYGKTQTVVVGGKEQQVTVDEVYLAQAIREPGTHRVQGYPPAMPALSLTDEEIRQVIAYLRELK